MVRDLAEVHECVSDIFKRPSSKEQWEAFRLSDEQVAFFHENGYLSKVRILDEQQIETLKTELDRLFDPKHERNDLFYEYHSNESDDPNKILFHALGAWRVEPGMHDILFSAAFNMAASQLLDGAVRFWHDQLFCKPAKHGGVVAWHQDYSYWTRTIPMSHLTCWIGLDKATKDNGCLQYIPKSHRWDLLPITGLAGNMDSIREVLNDEQWEQFKEPVYIELEPGECAFHHPLMVHGSQENKTDRPRRAVVLNVFKDGVISDSDEPPLQGVPPIAKGKKMEGTFFPLLFDPDMV